MKKMWLLSVFSFLLCLLSLGVRAEEAEEIVDPIEVKFGIYVVDLENFDIKTHRIEADIWVWALWPKDRDFNIKNLEVSNGTILSYTPIEVSTIGEQKYTAGRMRVRFKSPLNFALYPFDDQVLFLGFEDQEATSDELVLVADTEDQGIAPGIILPGWDIIKMNSFVDEHFYHSGFGHPSFAELDGSDYSRIGYYINIERSGSVWQKFLKCFWAVIISTCVSLVGLFLKTEYLTIRSSIGVGGLFANVGSLWVIVNTLPSSPVLTFAEKFCYFSLFVIFCALLINVLVGRYGKQYPRIMKYDHVIGFFMLGGYLLCVLITTFMTAY